MGGAAGLGRLLVVIAAAIAFIPVAALLAIFWPDLWADNSIYLHG